MHCNRYDHQIPTFLNIFSKVFSLQYPHMNLHSPIKEIGRLDEAHLKALTKLGIKTIEDLLYHFPVRYGDTASVQSIASLKKGDAAIIFGKITKLKTSKGFRTRIAMADAVITDQSSSIKAVWFHQPYLAKMISEESFVRAEGKISERKGELYMSNPKIEVVTTLPIGVGNSLFGSEGQKDILYPVYPESKGVTSNWIYHAIQKILTPSFLDSLDDAIPAEILEQYHLPSLRTALVWIHGPQKMQDADVARKRFAFEEIFMIQLRKQMQRRIYEEQNAFSIEKQPEDIREFVDRFPFKETPAQARAIETILADFSKSSPMSRLLEGDVGSGKTAVAASTAFAIVTTRPRGQDFGTLQVAYMAPTEILAKQHYESFIKYFRHLPIQIGLITGSGCKKFPSKVNPEGFTDISRTQLLKWVANGEIPILIGTHALIQKEVKFKNLAYVVIDEQHRFGTAQRQKLARKDGRAPHLLSMTATPIPRTLALTVYGDLDITLLDQMPLGRKPVITEMVWPNNREKVYEHIRALLKEGRQAYIICPRIYEPDPDKEGSLNAKSVTEEAERLQRDIFKEYTIDILHSKMSAKEKDEIMADFSAHKTDILVATSVVEVGVNVPNATVIVIEGAERFGLSQLHQLRGRVIRGTHQPYCYLFAETKSQKTVDRLKALITAKNGFELAEQDLMLRGAGELYGRRQWGLSDLAMEGIKNIKMVEAARTEAARIIHEDPTLSDYPKLASHIAHQKDEIHFE